MDVTVLNLSNVSVWIPTIQILFGRTISHTTVQNTKVFFSFVTVDVLLKCFSKGQEQSPSHLAYNL